MKIKQEKFVIVALALIALSIFAFVAFISPNSDSGLSVSENNHSGDSVQEDTSTAIGTGIINFRPSRRN